MGSAKEYNCDVSVEKKTWFLLSVVNDLRVKQIPMYSIK